MRLLLLLLRPRHLFAALLVSCGALVSRAQLALDGEQCQQPVPPKNAVLADTIRLQEERKFPLFGRVSFMCKIGYEASKTSVMTSLCMPGGRWNPDPRQSSCRRKNRVGTCDMDEFRCKKDNKCIPNERRCDCRQDCVDGSDERTCDRPRQIILAGSTATRMTGSIGSPGFRFNYPKKFKCYYTFIANPNQRFVMRFNQFDLLRRTTLGGCRDYVSMVSMDASSVLVDHTAPATKSRSTTASEMTGAKHCGRDDVPEFKSDSSVVTMLVNFGSGKLLSKETRSLLQGFSMEWQVVTASTDTPTSNEGSLATNSSDNNRRRVDGSLLDGGGRSDGGSLLEGGENSTQYLTMILLPIALSLGVPVALLLLMCCRGDKSPKSAMPVGSTCSARDSVVEIAADDAAVQSCKLLSHGDGSVHFLKPPTDARSSSHRHHNNYNHHHHHHNGARLSIKAANHSSSSSPRSAAAPPLGRSKYLGDGSFSSSQSKQRSDHIVAASMYSAHKNNLNEYARNKRKSRRARELAGNQRQLTGGGDSDTDEQTQFYTVDDIHRSSATGTDDTPISGYA